MNPPTPEQEVGLDAEHPWPGLEQFREGDSSFFKGRHAEAAELLRLVKRERLTVLFGLSGHGKSSLMQAGLFPLLRAERSLPVYLRISYDETGPAPRVQVLSALARAAVSDGIEAPEMVASESLWEHFHRHGSAYWTSESLPVTPVLVFDQFEEAFTHGRQTADRAAATAAFLEELADLVEGRVPPALLARLDAGEEDPRRFRFDRHAYKVLITIREDFLADLEMLRDAAPSLGANRMRLQALRGSAALEVTQVGGERLVPRGVGERIVRLVAPREEKRGATPLDQLVVEPALLSLFCRKLNDRRRMLGLESMTAELVEGNRESILKEFYEESLAGLDPGVRLFVEDHLLTKSGFRDTVALENALGIPGVTASAIDTLVQRRLVRQEDREGRTRLELTHDVLAEVVREGRDRRHADEALERARQSAEFQSFALARARREVRRSRVVVGVMAMLILVAGVMGLAAWRAVLSARQARAFAEQQLTVNEFIEATRLQADVSVYEALAHLGPALRRAPADVSVRALTLALLPQLAPPALTLPHKGPVAYAEFSPDGRHIVTASLDSTAQLWDAATGKAVGPRLRHRGPLSYATFSPDGRLVVTVSFDSTAQVWNAATGERVGRELRHHGRVFRASFSPDGGRIVTASLDSTAQVWDVASGTRVGPPLQHRRWVYLASFSPDGRRVATGAIDSTVQVWNAATGARLGPPMLHRGSVYGLKFSPDGRRLASASGDSSVRVWNVATMQLAGPPLRHDGEVYNVVFSRDGQRVVTTSEDRRAQVWNVETGRPIGHALVHVGEVTNAEFSPDGARVVTSSLDNTAYVWDAETGERVGPSLVHGGGVLNASFSPDGRRIVTASDDHAAQVWDVGATIARPPTLMHRGTVTSLAFSPDGRRLVTTLGVAFAPNGRRSAAAPDDRVAQQWDAETGRRLGPELHHSAPITSAAYSPDGKLLVTTSEDSTAQLWDVATGGRLGAPFRHGAAVSCAAFSPDGQWLATGARDGMAQLWDARSGARRGAPIKHRGWVLSIGFSPDGKRVITGSRDSTARIWDATTGVHVGSPIQHDGWVSSASFSHDGRRVVTASYDFTAQIWDPVTAQRLGPGLRHSGSVIQAQFSPDDRRVATASLDSTAQLWDAATGRRLGPAMHQGDWVLDADFSPNGRYLATGSRDRTAQLWDVRIGDSSEARDIARLAEAVARRRISTTGAREIIPADVAGAVVDSFRQVARRETATTPGSFHEFLAWYFAPPDRRPAFPGAPSWTADSVHAARAAPDRVARAAAGPPSRTGGSGSSHQRPSGL